MFKYRSIKGKYAAYTAVDENYGNCIKVANNITNTVLAIVPIDEVGLKIGIIRANFIMDCLLVDSKKNKTDEEELITTRNAIKIIKSLNEKQENGKLKDWRSMPPKKENKVEPKKETPIDPKKEKKNTIKQSDIDAIIAKSKIEKMTWGNKTTCVKAELPNGFVIVETSSCVDPSNYDEELGVSLCLKRIKDRIWQLEGYKLQCELSESK